MSDTKMKGVLSPVVTPFDRDLKPDAKRLINHCKWLLSNDVGLAVFGTNSEANSLSLAEKRLDTSRAREDAARQHLHRTGSWPGRLESTRLDMMNHAPPASPQRLAPWRS